MSATIFLISIISLAFFGLIAGLGLAYASKKFHVEEDPRLEKIFHILPGTNCGACGQAGCHGLAEAIVFGKAKASDCPVGGEEVAQQIAQVMGVEACAACAQVAYVACRGTKEKAKERADYQGIKDCRAAELAGSGSKACLYGCLGLGTCVEICPFDAFEYDGENPPRINPEKCTGCGLCLKACPRGIIKLVPRKNPHTQVYVFCNSPERSGAVSKICKVGCTACTLCVKKCPEGAFAMVNNLATVNYEKTIDPEQCIKVCPFGTIQKA